MLILLTTQKQRPSRSCFASSATKQRSSGWPLGTFLPHAKRLALGYAALGAGLRRPGQLFDNRLELMQDEGATELLTHECQDARATPVRELDLVRGNQRFGAA